MKTINRLCFMILFWGLCICSCSQTFFCSKINGETILKNKKYLTISYDKMLNMPNYVGEILTYDMTVGPNKREESFYREPQYSTVKISDYNLRGYDKGHIAAAANYRGTSVGMYETFSICNVAMQSTQLNRNWWLKLENTIRKQTKYCDRIYVVTGTITDDKAYSKIAVPIGFWKAVIGVRNGRKIVSCAWLYNNVDYKQIVEDTKMSIDKLESILGVDLFPTLNKKDNLVEKKTFYFK